MKIYHMSGFESIFLSSFQSRPIFRSFTLNSQSNFSSFTTYPLSPCTVVYHYYMIVRLLGVTCSITSISHRNSCFSRNMQLKTPRRASIIGMLFWKKIMSSEMAARNTMTRLTVKVPNHMIPKVR